jgi:class 3 adenylate cyclase
VARPPQTRYVKTPDGIHLAWSEAGEGPDLLYIPTLMQQLEVVWSHPEPASFFERLASFSRLIQFDRRGVGLSDPLPRQVTLEEQMDDVETILDAAGSERAALFAQAEGGAMAAMYAASHPDRVRALVLYAPIARTLGAPGYEWPGDAAIRAERMRNMLEHWGDGSYFELLAPSRAHDRGLREWFGRLQRHAMSPGTAEESFAVNESMDVRDVLPLISVPTLLLHRTDDLAFDVRHSRYFAEHIPGAKYVEMPGRDSLVTAGDGDVLLSEVEEFLTGARRRPEPDRILATVLFTDIVGSTRRAAELGDTAWRQLLGRHDQAVREEIEAHRGRPIKSLGDGWLATFDGPARGIRAALGIRERLRDLGLPVRAGLHTGEAEVIGDDVGGMAVHIGARISAMAEAEEVLVSGTVKDLVVGSGLGFHDRGEHDLKGVPGPWRLYAVAD